MKPIDMHTQQHGAVRVNSASIRRAADGIACIEIDLLSKYAEIACVGYGKDEAPCVYFCAGTDTLHVDESQSRDSLTCVAFPDYVGWEVFAADGPGRYTARVVLMKAEQ